MGHRQHQCVYFQTQTKQISSPTTVASFFEPVEDVGFPQDIMIAFRGRFAWVCTSSSLDGVAFGLVMMLPVIEPKASPSDFAEDQLAVVGPFGGIWKARHLSVSGHGDGYEQREILNSIFCRTGSDALAVP